MYRNRTAALRQLTARCQAVIIHMHCSSVIFCSVLLPVHTIIKTREEETGFQGKVEYELFCHWIRWQSTLLFEWANLHKYPPLCLVLFGLEYVLFGPSQKSSIQNKEQGMVKEKKISLSRYKSFEKLCEWINTVTE